jgi:hypothetical protein
MKLRSHRPVEKDEVEVLTTSTEGILGNEVGETARLKAAANLVKMQIAHYRRGEMREPVICGEAALRNFITPSRELLLRVTRTQVADGEIIDPKEIISRLRQIEYFGILVERATGMIEDKFNIRKEPPRIEIKVKP